MDILDVRDIYFSFSGRIRRRTWWLAGLGLGAFNWLVQSAVAPVIVGDLGRPTMDGLIAILPPKRMMMTVGLGLVLLWPCFAMAVKRAHDRDRSGRVVVALIALNAVIGWSSVAAITYGVISSLQYWIALAVGFPLFVYVGIVLGFLPGTVGTNAYGPDPKTTPVQSRPLN